MGKATLTVVFRVDASIEMGTGHVMRCLTLADALAQNGANCHFICREITGNLIETVRNRGYEVHHLPAPSSSVDLNKTVVPHEHWLGVSWAEDAAQSFDVMRKHQLHADWLVVDHYAIDSRWETAMEPVFDKLFVIDDLADRDHIADLLLDQNLGRCDADYDDRVPERCVRLIGPKYALLRPEFARLRPYSLKRREHPQLKHILITMGGVDKDNITGVVLDAMDGMDLPSDVRISVILGSGAPWAQAVRSQAATLAVPVTVYVDVHNMAEMMLGADLVIGAAGSTAWERCCLGLPSIMVVLAANQQQVAKGLQAVHAAKALAESTEIPHGVPAFMGEMLHSPDRMLQMSKAATNVTDGAGTDRVTRYLE